VTMPFVDLPDARLFYETAGESGSRVLLIMGFGVPGHMWLNQIPTLSKHHQVAWFDNCGAGGRTEQRRNRPYTMRDFSRHAVSVLDALDWPDAHVVGVSMGGMVAQELALSFKGRVRSLSLVATHAGGIRNFLPPIVSLYLFLRGFLGPRHLRARALQRLIFPDHYLDKLDLALISKALEEHVVAAAPARDRLLQMAAVFTHRASRRLHQLAQTPTLVVKACQDRLIRPEEHHRLHRLIPGSRLVEFEDAGHALLHQCAERLNHVLLEHFADVDGALTRRSA
jgi:3-oxoadipate enol-lactonase